MSAFEFSPTRVFSVSGCPASCTSRFAKPSKDEFSLESLDPLSSSRLELRTNQAFHLRLPSAFAQFPFSRGIPLSAQPRCLAGLSVRFRACQRVVSRRHWERLRKRTLTRQRSSHFCPGSPTQCRRHPQSPVTSTQLNRFAFPQLGHNQPPVPPKPARLHWVARPAWSNSLGWDWYPSYILYMFANHLRAGLRSLSD